LLGFGIFLRIHVSLLKLCLLPPCGGGSEILDLRSKSLDFAGEGLLINIYNPSPEKTKGLLTQAQVFSSSPSRGEEAFTAARS
jgi:hypothetical protein